MPDGFQQQIDRVGGLMNGLGGAPSAVRLELEDRATDTDLAIEVLEDGTVAITSPAVISHRDDEDANFDENLAEHVDGNVLMRLADEAIMGVSADEISRGELIEQYNKGLELLGTKIEDVSAARSEKKGISKVGNPLLIEAMVKYASGAIGEMLPAAGPAKVATTGRVTAEEEQVAQDFTDDLNYYLTEIATEYYPDTRKMLMHQAYGGNAYKKLYRCALRDRPVSERVSMIDLIVSEEANDLDSAIRVTHQFFPSRSQVRRMQILARYRSDLALGQPTSTLPSANRAIKSTEGIAPVGMRPQDMPFHFLEVDMDIDVDEFPIFGKFERAAPPGLPLPYKVTIERDSRQVFALWRNWDQTDYLYRKDNMYVHYGLVPGMGFHDWGFLQLLGNQTRALRAVWRILIDSGMFSNFPGGIKVKGARTSTNEISPAPGEFVDIDVPGSTDIRQVIMALPYKAVDAVFIQFAQMVQESAERLGGAVTIESGEGRTNVPVGTIMSQIEQNTQIMAAVHKNNHLSQKYELMKLRKLFARNPRDLWAANPDPRRQWNVAREFMDLNLMPASDPNIPSQVSRIMQAWALIMLVQQAPGEFDVQECLRRVLTAIRIAEPQTLLISPDQKQPPPPDPRAMAEAAKAQAQQAQTAAKTGQIQLQAEADKAKNAAGLAQSQADAQSTVEEQRMKAQSAALESADRAADRQSKERVAAIKVQGDLAKTQAEHAHAAGQAHLDRRHEAGLAQLGQAHDVFQRQQEQAHEAQQTQVDQAHEAQIAQQNQQHEADRAARDRSQNGFDRAI